MKNKKKFIILGLIILIIIGVIGSLGYFYFKDTTKLNATEKRYLANNSNTVLNFKVLNNVNLFGKTGGGLFYDFINDFEKKYDLKTNNITYNLGESVDSISFGVSNELKSNEISFYEDHYVLVSNNYEYISDISSLNNQSIGLLNENLSYISNYLNNITNANFKTYADNEEMLKEFKNQTNIKYIIVPLNLYIDQILENNYSIAYHFSDIKYYYKIDIGTDSLGSIVKKYYQSWYNDKFVEYYNDRLFNLFLSSLNISSTEVDAMRSITYNYGFVDNGPYEILTSGNYGGVIAQYLKEFSDFSDVDLNFTKYKTYNRLDKAINSDKVELYFSYYNFNNSFDSIHSGINAHYVVLADKKNEIVVNSLKSLSGKEVYVEKNSALYSFLSNYNYIKLKTYKDYEDLQKIAKKNKIFIVDSQVYDTNRGGVFNSYTVRYSKNENCDYLFKVNANETFTKLLDKFINYKDPYVNVNKGIRNYELTWKNGTITGTIAKYFMYILFILIIVFLYLYKFTRKVKISKKIKKEDKIKYIDQLTSLKNRNYLSENLDSWSKNTIYPQAIIVIDLNNLQEINDTMGYEQGDIQIKAAANILVKTQLDNSDVIRTDGNEFVIYLIGYQSKQVSSYIHKLNKEFKKLPYEYGAAIGYSMIVDDIKSIEDALNEAIEDIKKQKENKKEAES